MKADEEILLCPNCKTIIKEEDYVTEYESRGQFWGVPCQEEIITGYKCSVCGKSGEF